MSNVVYLITGANRPNGIGFLAIQNLLLDPQAQVIAAVRDPASASDLLALEKSSEGRVKVVKMDVGDLESVKASFTEVAGLPFVREHGIDVLFANAGVFTGAMVPASKMDPTDALKDFQVNTWGAIYVAQVFLPLLRLGTQKKIVYTSSALGSTTFAFDAGIGGAFASYGMSKAATNHFFKRLAGELKEDGFTVVCYHPGVVGTSLSGVKAGETLGGIVAITPEEGGRLAATHINSWGPKDNGKFFGETGEEILW
ncbi:hypothetical protein BDY24DRAFT_400849 [Mrakia frigida]|uniref:uncharacterized protein n=1 Tax=Mrakia frigida TaxID=29902 RepID=UPI003FCC1C54